MLCRFDTGFINLTDRYLTWKICEFSSLPICVGCEIRSPQFVYRNIRYTLAIWPRGTKATGSEGWFGICLYKGSGARSTDPAQFSIVNGQGTIKTCTVNCSEHNIFKEARFLEWSDFSTLIHKIAPKDCLTIVCRLPVESDSEEPNQNGDVMDMLVHPMKDPPVKFQSGDYHSLDAMPMMTSVSLANPLVQPSSCMNPGISHGSPSTINSFFSTSSHENSFEVVPESVDMENQNLKVPSNVPNAANSQSTFWSYFTGKLPQSSKTDQPGGTLDPVTSMSENTAPEQADDCATLVAEETDSSEFQNSSGSSSSDASSVNSKVCLPEITTYKSHPSLDKVLVPRSEQTDSQNTTQVKTSPNNNATQNVLVESASSSHQRAHRIAETSSSADHCPKGLKILSQHIKDIYLQGKFSDLTIIMEGREFKVLRAILMSRSPVFEEMFTQDTGNIISISSFDACDSSTFHDFLLYVYSGEIQLSHKNVYGLYSAACKFVVPDLREECVRFLRLSLLYSRIIFL